MSLHVRFQVVREGGAIGQVKVTWSSVNDTEGDLMESDGVIVFEDGQKDGEITVRIRGDTIPELEEHFGIVLVNSSKVSGKYQVIINKSGQSHPNISWCSIFLCC